MRDHIARAVLAGAAAAGLLLATGCGENYGSSTPPAATGGTSAASGNEGTVVTVKETEFVLDLSQQTFSPGTYTFVAQNDGKAPHALEVQGPGGEKKTSTLNPGGSERLTIELQKGTYEVYCPVGNHKDRGMKTEITVG